MPTTGATSIPRLPRHYGLAKSGVEIDTELYHQVVTFQEGRMIRIEYFATWAEALEAAGIPASG